MAALVFWQAIRAAGDALLIAVARGGIEVEPAFDAGHAALRVGRVAIAVDVIIGVGLEPAPRPRAGLAALARGG